MAGLLRPKPLTEVASTARIKEYPDHYSVCVASRPLFMPEGMECVSSRSRSVRDLDDIPDPDKDRSRSESLRRARQNIYDIASCSRFTHFVTLTIDPARLERYDYSQIIRKVNTWLGNAVRRREVAYLVIPEHHKDGAIHFHGLFRGDFDYINSGKKTKAGQPIFNLKNWKFGFTACVELEGEYSKIVNYIRKYITKNSQKVGGRWYLSGGDIAKPKIELAEIEFEDVEAEAHIVKGAGIAFKYMTIEKSE